MPKKILIVDDEQELVTLFSDVLTSAGFEIVGALDGRQALSAAKKHKPDMILLDIKMPDEDGFEVLKKIKSDSSLQNIKVIMLTNMQGQGYIDSATKLGADDYWYKMNTHLVDLVAKVRELLD